MAYRTEAFVRSLASDFIEPIGRRSSHTSSRLAVLPDRTMKPVLLLLAERKFREWDDEHFPFWLDGDRTNETLSNVGLALRAPRSPRKRRRAPIPSGTREYMKHWREAHPDLVRAAQLRYATKRQAALNAAAPGETEASGETTTKTHKDGT